MVKLLHVGLFPHSSHLLSLAVKFLSSFLNRLGTAEHKSQVTLAMISDVIVCYELDNKNTKCKKYITLRSVFFTLHRIWWSKLTFIITQKIRSLLF